MRGWPWLVIAVGCRGAPPPAAVPAPPVIHPAAQRAPASPSSPSSSCDPAVPAAACAAFRAVAHAGVLAPCALDTKDRLGEWRYALVAPLYTVTDDVTSAELASMWRGDAKRTLSASAETQMALAGGLGAAPVPTAPGRPELGAARWAIVPADELSPQWKVITVDGHHPLDDGGGPLSLGLCAPATHARVANIDRAELTTVAMTGVTAMARYTAVLMDKKGTTYPARDVLHWFDHLDYVHVSNEVSFVPSCDPKGDRTQPFCSRESYIELMEAIHANIIELDGSHLSDFGWKWFTHTIEMYEQRHWQFFGGGRDQTEATRPLLVEHAGTKLAFLGCNMPHSTSHTIRNGPNVGYCDLSRLDWEVRDLRKRGYTPIVSIQHEEVYTHTPPDVVVRDFRRLAADGAAVVFGSQAHWAHPFEVVDGAYVHYGAGNFFFDQSWKGAQDATADRLYFYRGRLLTVGHLFTRLEEAGRPRPMTERERAGFLRELGDELAKLPKADPWRAPRDVAAPRAIPDSFLVGSEAIQLAVAMPRDAAATHPLVIDLHAHAAKAHGRDLCATSSTPGWECGSIDDAVEVSLRRTPKLGGAKLATAITDFVCSHYPIDRARVTVR